METAQLLQRIAPDLARAVEDRYAILRQIRFLQPIGRRALAERMGLPERRVRREVDRLRRLGLVTAGAGGMLVTPAGEGLLPALGQLVGALRGLSELEEFLARRLGLPRVIVVPGDSDQDLTVKQEMARVTAEYLREILQDGQILAVTGGSTLGEVARALPRALSPLRVTVVPARGGLGEEVELQANHVAAEFARGLGGSYRLLHAPDELGAESYASLVNEPKIREVLELIQQADILLHGIGTAEEMARRRGMSPAEIRVLRERGAVGEAFGYYFDARGRIVYTTTSLGVSWQDLERIPHVVAVGGGSSKARAALAVLGRGVRQICITDEGAARRMAELLAGGESRPAVAGAHPTQGGEVTWPFG